MNKICPFCGSQDTSVSVRVSERKRDTGTFHIAAVCKNCKAQGPRIVFHARSIEMYDDTETKRTAERQAIAAWNIRANNN